MPSASSIFTEHADVDDKPQSTDQLRDSDGVSSFRRKGETLVSDVEISLSTLHDLKEFNSTIRKIVSRAGSWVVSSRQVIRVALYSFEVELLDMFRACSDRLPSESVCHCLDEMDSSIAESKRNGNRVPCKLCSHWRNFLQVLFDTFVAKAKRKRIKNQTC